MKKAWIAVSVFGMVLAGSQVFGAAAGDATKGKATFDDNCAVCHNADSEEKKVGPGLKGLFKRAKLHNGKAVNDANVLAMINAGGGGMPPYSDVLGDEEKANVVAYLKTL